ncbi:MAG TPA: ABC transporter permease [Bacillota bacterium]|nr:ABC transporter permease [Bacillota bacterium]
MLRHSSLVAGGILVLAVIICAIFAPHLAPYNPLVGHLADRLDPPSWVAGGSHTHFLGADAVGRDLFSRIIYGTRISLLVGFTSAAASAVIGTALGMFAAYYGGMAETVVMRLVDLVLAFPFILLAIMIVAILGPGLSKIIFVLAATQWAGFARIVRGETLSMKEREFVEAARALGLKGWRVMIRHILPNIASSIIVLFTIAVAVNILAESSLSYLGLGVDPRIPTWGGMLAEGQLYITTAWWVATFPGIAIMLTVMGFNLIGDWLRDKIDPKYRV